MLVCFLHRQSENDDGTARLEEAVGAYRETLKERTQEQVPLDSAMTQNNLGITLSTLGKTGEGTARLEEALGAYREALKECTQERVPLQSAATPSNLGSALSTLGQRESGTASLEQAIAAYDAASPSSCAHGRTTTRANVELTDIGCLRGSLN